MVASARWVRRERCASRCVRSGQNDIVIVDEDERMSRVGRRRWVSDDDDDLFGS